MIVHEDEGYAIKFADGTFLIESGAVRIYKKTGFAQRRITTEVKTYNAYKSNKWMNWRIKYVDCKIVKVKVTVEVVESEDKVQKMQNNTGQQ